MRGLFAAPDVENAVLRPADVLPAQAGALFAQQLVWVVIVRGGFQVIAAVARLADHKIVVAEQDLPLRRALGKPLLDAARVIGAGHKADALRLGLILFVRRSPSAPRKLCCLAQVFVHSRSLLSSLYAKYRRQAGFFQANSASIDKNRAQVYCYIAKKAGNSCLFSFHSKIG